MSMCHINANVDLDVANAVTLCIPTGCSSNCTSSIYIVMLYPSYSIPSQTASCDDEERPTVCSL